MEINRSLESDSIERYFSRLYEGGWVGVECLMTKSQIEASSIEFIRGVFLATAVACIEDDHECARQEVAARRALLYGQYGGLQGVIGELVRRMKFDWQYIPVNARSAEDWVSPALPWLRVESTTVDTPESKLRPVTR